MPDFDIGFRTATERLDGEAVRRHELSKRRLKFHVAYLDDFCRALMPHDLVLIGARTGAGKTTLAEIIATANAAEGKRVHYFALEAEPDEIERHLKFRWIARHQWEECRISGFNYPDWYLGEFDNQLGSLSMRASGALAHEYQTLNTFYRRRDFTHADVKRLFLAVRNDTDLIVLDHLHYVDAPEGASENQAQKELVKVIRDCSLSMGVPIVVVAHLRKKGTRKTLMPDADDVMGSSDITKIATRLILIAPAVNKTRKSKTRYPTYMYVEKDRLCGSSRLVALIDYNIESGRYEPDYYLGEMDVVGENFTALSNYPAWAKKAKPYVPGIDL